RGNIYLAKVTRVEPSLQAAFVEYGGNRHGFLAFSEIHPDYYQIPMADRQALLAEEERAHRAADAEVDRRAGRRNHRRHQPAAFSNDGDVKSAPVASDELGHDEFGDHELGHHENAHHDEGFHDDASRDSVETIGQPISETGHDRAAPSGPDIAPENAWTQLDAPSSSQPSGEFETPVADETSAASGASEVSENAPAASDTHIEDVDTEEEIVESVGGGDALEEVPERMPRSRRQYKIQEVIKRRQVMLVQVVKEERGTKGAALTTYLSLAGRYSVLMPNTARGGGISRKITSAQDRLRLKEIAQELQVPEGMGVILRTAGANRTKAEVKRDFEYLIRMWETVRDVTLRSTAPTLVYEEGSLIKRSIRDLYNKDIDEVIVAGDDAYREAREFMRMLMPSHAKNVKPFKDTQPVFTRYGIESQLDAMFSPTVQLRSGGYIVLNQTEALVSIDVNSGRATREHHIEDTALKTNLEASEEIARQLRLRDLAGLVVIDFIDMDESRNNRAVERRLKECLKHDRARIQVGRISHFGLLEMSRQRIRTSVLESSTEKCPHCGGTGHMRSVSSVTLQLLRSIEEMLFKGATHNLIVRSRSEVALYVLNHKRAHLRDLEQRFQITITINADDTIGGSLSFSVDKGEQVHTPEAARALAAHATIIAPSPVEDEDLDEDIEEDIEETSVEQEAEGAPEPEQNGEGSHRRRRRRRRRSPRGEVGEQHHEHTPHEHAEVRAEDELAEHEGEETEPTDEQPRPEHGHREAGDESHGEGERRRRRRGRRGGRRRRGRNGEAEAPTFHAEGDQHEGDSFEREPHVGQSDQPAHSFQQPAYEAPAESYQPQPGSPASDVTERPAESDAPRRRSTVREPAPLYLSDEAVRSAPVPAQPEPAPEPSSAPETATPNQPRRTGWWARRFGGGKE
ncbi:MAG TPA: Rne/Rng family ribonuclease, partial [Xanthobacteraceae bacterium]|nr:Rne/Rng family ribonuclease [Xanthobacteraceae bacterium]